MAEILLLPVRSCGSDQSVRLHADLAAAHARGEPLGSRVPHIQAGGERLLELSRVFKDAVDKLDQTLTKLGLQGLADTETLQQFVASMQDLADTAQQYSPDA
ncbi:hypothetical protein ACQKQD_32870 [Methylobacterium sp. NPDC080182]|uniref:hypothetical protein n=1 Tax=Methylobacterium sp. NPDC080182 TaxID=3390590 RepID=UPI003D05DFD3